MIDFTGDVTVTYSVSDGLLWGSSAKGAITVTPVVSAPDASSVNALRLAAAAATSTEPLRYDGEDWYEVKIWEVGVQEGDGYRYRPTGDRNEIIYGSSGDDVIDCSNLNARFMVFGMDGADTIQGGNLSDYLFGWLQEATTSDLEHPETDLSGGGTGTNVQRIYGNGGNDFIFGGPCTDYIYGDSDTGTGTGSDNISGDKGDDVIYGDSVSGNGSGCDNIDGGLGNDTIYGDTETGAGSGNDTIMADDGDDVIYADSRSGEGTGTDEIYGGAGADTIYGDSELAAGSGADTIDGGDGNDVIYADSRVGDGSGRDEVDGGAGNDVIFGDSQLGAGSANDKLYGGDGDDVIYADSQEGVGSGDDVVLGDDGADQIYGDSYLAVGTGNDTILGGWGNDLVVGDSYQGAGSGSDRLDGGLDNDTMYGDSVAGNGSGSNIVYGSEGDDTIFGNSETGNGSGHDWIDAGAGTNTVYGDTRTGSGSGNDMIVAKEGNNTIYGDSDTGTGSGRDTIVLGQGTNVILGPGQVMEQQVQIQASEAALTSSSPTEAETAANSQVSAASQTIQLDTVIQSDGSPLSYSYQINGKTAMYKENPDTGEVMVYDHLFGRWDVVGERYWNAEIGAWITNMGRDIVVEYADKTLRYDNYSTDIEIKTWDGTWEPYDPDQHYKVDFRQDPETGKLLIYNNDLDTYDPYMEAYRPAGANYTVLNEGASIHIVYDDGAELWLENYGEGAWLKAPQTGERWVTLPGTQIYHDASTGIWYCYAQGTWHYSIDTCQTWVDVSMLDIRVVEGTGTVDMFDGKFWTHDHAATLQFFDARYAQSGWHGMNEFVVEYYDGVGYDGEPLRAVDVAVTGEESDDTVWLNNLSPTGTNPEPPSPDATVTRWDTYLYGQWDHKLLCSYSIFAPAGTTAYTSSTDLDGTSAMSATAAPSYCTWKSSEAITVIVHADDTPGAGWHQNGTGTAEWQFLSSGEALRKPIVYWHYSSTGYSLEQLVHDLEACTEKINKEKGLTGSNKLLIQNLAINNHANVGEFMIGSTDVTPENICSRYYGLFKQLNTIMVDGGQIQHYGCRIAGVNPYQYPEYESEVYETGTVENESWYARRMLATIAEASKCYVFASSDYSYLIVEKLSIDGTLRYVVTWNTNMFGRSTETCLEFGVGPDGKQVGYLMCDQRPWNLNNWLLSTGSYPSSLQDLDRDDIYMNGHGVIISTKGEEPVDRSYTPLTYAWP